jgi:hypothetical protein
VQPALQMNTTEHIVESYYRLVKKCFTVSDIKVIRGNNRQFDLLAFHRPTESISHIEVSVTHQLNWTATLEKLEPFVAYKFFGAARDNSNRSENTDAARGKNYYQEICNTYQAYWIRPADVNRVICVWALPETDEQKNEWLIRQSRIHHIRPGRISFLFFRDKVIPELLESIGRSNYDDEILRTLSFLKQFREQTDSDASFT